ncbi:MAG: flavodoxin [Treponema sp.]|jgi:flavodoxin|nr:flavodoxin [Treponema sp.]
MNIAVRYLSKTGNTEKVARAIAEALGVEAVPLTGSSAIEEETGVLFLGVAVYAFGIDAAVTAFIQKLDKAKVKNVAVFSTSAIVKSMRAPVKKLLSEKGIPLLDKEFHCWGKFKFMRKGHPNASDLERAKGFAKDIMEMSRNV